MNVRFIGCLHLGHLNMARYRGFQDEHYYNDHLVQEWNKVVTSKKDITYILGDVTMETKEWYFMLDQLNGIKHVVLGNHDRRQDVPELMRYVETVGGMVDHKGYALTHCPIHPNELGFYKGNIHAHIHHRNKLEEVHISNSYTDEGALIVPTLHKYINVDAKVVNYRPKTIEELINEQNK